MSTIYTDGANNKYLGDCKWGAHSISYPTTNYLVGATSNTLLELWDDFKSVFVAANYNNIYTSPTLPPYGTAADIFRFTFPSVTNSSLGFRRRQNGINYNHSDTVTVNNNSLSGMQRVGNAQLVSHFQYEIGVPSSVPNLHYVVSCGPRSCAYFLHAASPWANLSDRDTEFMYYGLLEDINPNFGYYTNQLNHSILLNYFFTPTQGNTYSRTTAQLNLAFGFATNHYIASATKSLLQTGRAAYAIVCADGQTSSSQWATDMWVYENNSVLGNPVIGRVPNMLLGVGTYTYLKPVRIVGDFFPDGGSPWYLPVGTFAGKTLLMRCYSSM